MKEETPIAIPDIGKLVLSIISVLLLMGINFSYGNEATLGGKWQRLPDMPTPRTEVDGVIHDGVIYVAGGFSAGRTTSAAFEAYHVKDSRWETLPDMPQPSHHPAVTAADGKIYVSGGWYGAPRQPGRRMLNCLWAYDIATRKWRQKADMPYRWGAHRKVHYNGGLYVITGSGQQPSHVLRYDIKKDSWKVLDARLEVTRDHAAITQVGDEFYIISGRSAGRDEQPRVDVFNLSTYEFRRLADIPTPRAGGTAEYANGRIYVVGGEVVGDRGDDNHIALDNVEVYDIERETWLRGPDLPYTIHAQASGQHDGFVYVMGGSTAAWVASYDTLTGNTFVLDTNR